MTMNYEQWEKILSEINNDEDLNKDNIIEKLKEKLKVEDEDEYKEWEEAGSDVNYRFGIKYTEARVERGFFGLPSICHKVEIHQTTLFSLAAITGYVKIVEALIEKGIDINATDKDGLTPLHEVVGNGHVEVMNILIKKGANVNAVGKDGHTLLHVAAYVDNKEIVEFLIKKGLNINLANKYGHSPLHIAADRNNKKVVEVLIKNGANVNAVSENGFTPLHFAASHFFHRETINALIEGGADPLLKDNFGKTPIDSNISGYIIEFLEKKAIKKGVFYGGSTALLCTAIAVALFTTGVVEVGLMPIIIAVVAIATAALAVGGLTYMTLKPSTEIEGQNVEETAHEGKQGLSA
ncbi:ankyrin repeat domain-containing protein [Wolbachia endosymbiont of Folsomia candida]|uniref:ankyrin repeat domain-containing protein n=1 Tax=Wolbachia endosymbiont of Folsomia candida TaxID=169402 RepID=UPI000DBF249E|nr:ankyrin repeat domain-containing protein [Wolbachia endosymbiont of Folsomia candida]APR98867.2 hypothetical protein ASM33_06630 [Wolbachia endosymbiont of Folsomia candida]